MHCQTSACDGPRWAHLSRYRVRARTARLTTRIPVRAPSRRRRRTTAPIARAVTVGARGPGRGHLRRQAEMTQDASNHLRVFDERDQLEPIPATWTREDVEAKTPLHQLRPQPVRTQRDGRRGGRLHVVRALARDDRCVGLARPQARSPRRSRAEDAVIQQEIDPRERR